VAWLSHSTTPILASTAETILGYVEALAWPLVVVVIATCFLILFRANIAGLLDRMTEGRLPAGLGGFAAAPPSQNVGPVEDESIDSETLQLIVDGYEERLVEVEVTRAAVERLTGELVSAQLELDFERTYSAILGSQVRLLHALGEAHPASVPRAFVEALFDAEKTRWGLVLGSWSFEQWMGFLLRRGYGGRSLVEQLGDGTYKLTEKGGAFLGYLQSRGYPPKPF
jgi:hypothetical protein